MNDEQTQEHRRREGDMPGEAAALMRMVDFRIPLPWLLGGFAVALWAAVNMYFQLQRVTESLVLVQIEVKSGNTSVSTLAGEVALLKYRVEGIEADRRATGQAQQTGRLPR